MNTDAYATVGRVRMHAFEEHTGRVIGRTRAIEFRAISRKYSDRESSALSPSIKTRATLRNELSTNG